MNVTDTVEKDGISLRTVYSWLIVIAVIISGMMIYSTYHMTRTFLRLSDATEEYIKLEKAAYELMDASDYLTEKAQRFTIGGNRQYLDEYFIEAFETNRREDAIRKMSENPNSYAALRQLQHALDESRSLMQQEYYAMRLVIEAMGYSDYPEALRDIALSEADAGLKPEEKLRLATEKMLSEEYYRQKDRIRADMKESLRELEKLTRSTSEESARNLSSEMELVRIIIGIQTAGIFLMIWLTSCLGINPVLKAVEKIRDDSPIPEVGANEFRYLARTYNRMYNLYKKSVEHLNYKASHDELTEVYNRTGYDLLLSGIDLGSTCLLLFDLDNFKDINDSYGHEMGDKILKKLADTLRRHFRSDDYVCRIGGDEFVVLMVHADDQSRKLIENIVSQINREMSSTEDGLVTATVSAGVAHGSRAADAEALFAQADKALYTTKRNGKKSCTFYEE